MLVNSDAGGYRKILVINGDLGELDTKRRSAQLITANKSTILNTVRDVLEPATWDALYVVRGTSAHEGRSAWLEEEIGKDYHAIPSLPDVHSWWQIRANVNGKNFDIAHHANMSSVPWGRINSAGKLINLALWNYMIDRRVAPPDVIDRSHNHIYVPAIGNGIEAYFLPCWTAITEFGYRIGMENTMPSIGGLVHYVEEDGAIRTKLYEYKAEKEKRLWSMKL